MNNLGLTTTRDIKLYRVMNWGNKIALAFIAFAAFIGYMVFMAFQEDFDLVTENYYAAEINYQQKIDKLSNVQQSGNTILIKQMKDSIQLTFPVDQASGQIHFYHPSTSSLDRFYDVQLTSNSQYIATNDLFSGHCRIHIDWQSNGTDYLQESKIYLP